MRRTFAVLALSAAAAASTAAPAAEPAPDPAPARGVFCSVLDRALEAANDPAPFESQRINLISAPDRSRLTIPGFEGHACRVTRWGPDLRGSRASIVCSQTLAPPELTVDNLAADTARCLGVAPTAVNVREESVRFDLPKVRIHIEGDCTDACHVGRRVTFAVQIRD